MAGLTAVHLSADNTLCVLNGDSSFAVLHEGDDPDNSEENKNPKNNKYEILRLSGAFLACAETETPVLNKHIDGKGKSRDDTRKQENGDTVAYSVFVYLFTEPHHQRGARRKHKYDHNGGKDHVKAFSVLGYA